uniref:Uncharacterized protein n=1 Tax=Globisporangium ultimum (strain ATCC 200006 / CBS 805.95 / DAOM BR144) TaxID=431595 RepID=K3WEZ2_GLOUD
MAKKKEILQSEVVKLETCLRQRTELLFRLRQNHEKLVTVNGHLHSKSTRILRRNGLVRKFNTCKNLKQTSTY